MPCFDVVALWCGGCGDDIVVRWCCDVVVL